jgi:hypothetical protein
LAKYRYSTIFWPPPNRPPPSFRVFLSSGEVRRNHLGERVELGARTLGIAHKGFIEHEAEVTGPLAHLLQCAAGVAQQVDQRYAFGIEQLEREAHPLGRVLDPGEGSLHVRLQRASDGGDEVHLCAAPPDEKSPDVESRFLVKCPASTSL